MNKKNIRMGLGLFALSHAAVVCGLPDDKQRPVELRAGHVLINQDTHRITYTQHVKLDQGSMHLRAATASTLTDKHHQLKQATAHGDRMRQAHAWTSIAINKPPLHAYADEIRYYPQLHRLVLLGHARINQAPNAFLAPKITYDMLANHVITEASGDERTRIILDPPSRT